MKNREQSKVSATANDDVSLIIYFKLLRRANFSQKRDVRTNFSYSVVLTNDGLV